MKSKIRSLLQSIRQRLRKKDEFYKYADVLTPFQKSYIDIILRPFWKSLADNYSYESGIRRCVDKLNLAGAVCIVGGGNGIMATYIAKTNSDLTIDCFEGSLEYYKRCLLTKELNKYSLESNLTFHNKLVAENIGVYGQATSGLLPARDLPDCETLVMDCEGAEFTIIKNMKIRPKHIIVETHGFLGFPTSNTVALLERKGYSVLDKHVADDGMQKFCVDNDIFVLLAKLENTE